MSIGRIRLYYVNLADFFPVISFLFFSTTVPVLLFLNLFPGADPLLCLFADTLEDLTLPDSLFNLKGKEAKTPRQRKEINSTRSYTNYGQCKRPVYVHPGALYLFCFLGTVQEDFSFFGDLAFYCFLSFVFAGILIIGGVLQKKAAPPYTEDNKY